MANEPYHEAAETLSETTKNFHRAVVSLKEELEAIDWYTQRAEGATDDALRAVLVHNKNEEIEHAMMTLEWLRRNDGDFARHADTYLYTTAPIHEIESEKKAAEARAGAASSSLGVGSLRRS